MPSVWEIRISIPEGFFFHRQVLGVVPVRKATGATAVDRCCHRVVSIFFDPSVFRSLHAPFLMRPHAHGAHLPRACEHAGRIRIWPFFHRIRLHLLLCAVRSLHRSLLPSRSFTRLYTVLLVVHRVSEACGRDPAACTRTR